MKTHTYDFGNGVACTLKVLDKPSEGSQGSMFEAAGPEDTRRYVAWINSINKQLASEWNASLCHVFRTAPYAWEAWGYWPGKPSVFLGKVTGKMDLQPIKVAADKAAKKMGLPVGLFSHITVEQ